MDDSRALSRRNDALLRVKSTSRNVLLTAAISAGALTLVVGHELPGRSTTPSTPSVSQNTTPTAQNSSLATPGAGNSGTSAAPTPTTQVPVAVSGGSMP